MMIIDCQYGINHVKMIFLEDQYMSESFTLPPERLVPSYVKFIVGKRLNNQIFDVSHLLWPKKEIIDACLARLEKEPNSRIRGSIGNALLQISFFQEEIGPEGMHDCHLDLFEQDITSMDEDALVSLRKAVAAHLPHLNAPRFIDALRLVQAEFKNLHDRWIAIEDRWEKQEGSGVA